VELPYNTEIEYDVLGIVIKRPHMLVDANLQECHFFESSNKKIWSLFHSLKEGWSSANLKHNLEEEYHGLIDNLYARNVSYPSLSNSCDIIRDLAIKRKALEASQDIVDLVIKGESDLVGKIDKISCSLRDLNSTVPIDSCGTNYIIKRIREGRNNRCGNGIFTNYNILDEYIGELQAGFLFVVAARPGMGKTSFAINLIHNMLTSNKKAALFTLEMTADQIFHRFYGKLTNTPFSVFSRSEATEEQWIKAEERLSKYDGNLFVFDDAPVTIDQLITDSRRLVKTYGAEIIFVDYLQLISTGRRESRTSEVTEISNKLKNMAKELKVPVVCLSQLSRQCEMRVDKRPLLSDLRDSGSIEQDADLVAFLYSDDYYQDNNDDNHLMEVLLRKNRHGRTGTIRLTFEPALCKFSEVVY
jgi:replicative DNA helicase